MKDLEMLKKAIEEEYKIIDKEFTEISDLKEVNQKTYYEKLNYLQGRMETLLEIIQIIDKMKK